MLKLMIFMIGSDIAAQPIFKNLALKPSSPVALDGSRASSCFCTNVKETGFISNFVSGVNLSCTKLGMLALSIQWVYNRQ